MLKPADAAERLSVSPLTLQKWRVTGGGPRYVKVGRGVRYDPVDLANWIEARKVNSTSEAA